MIEIDIDKPNTFNHDEANEKVCEFLKRFKGDHFSSVEFNSFDSVNEFERLRNRAIELFANSEKVFKNESNPFIRIEGEKKAIEDGKEKLIDGLD